MDFKSMAISATLAGSVLMTGLTYTGTVDLGAIKDKAMNWATNVNTSVGSTQAMLDKFNLFKTDVTAQINAKIAKINELNASIAVLNSKVGAGEVSLDTANTEIARLNEEIDKANAEITALKAEMDAKDTEVTATMAEMETADSMDTTLALDTQNADVAPTTGGTTGEATSGDTGTTETTSDADSIDSALSTAYPALAADLTVTLTASTVTLSSNRIGEQSPYDYEQYIEAELGKEVTLASSSGNDRVYTINQ
jgi:outer membrane murein-binding lipoprotein Lpp